MVGGSYLAVRNIRQRMEVWDRVRLVEQEQIFGRDKAAGAPLSGGDEFTPMDFDKHDAAGGLAVDIASHVRRAHPGTNGGIRLLRRGYNFVNGNDATGNLDAGLFFLAYHRSPGRFITVQKSVATDLLAEYLVHVGSALFAVPPGAQPGSFVGAALFAG
jgi:deferrochelatase/peroxidase EfeB